MFTATIKFINQKESRLFSIFLIYEYSIYKMMKNKELMTKNVNSSLYVYDEPLVKHYQQQK